ncbi:MAG: hypothetical protein ABIQ59_05345 [Nocardioidaceae bacterium]
MDGPIQHLHGLRRLAHDAGSLPEVLARLLDAAPPAPGTTRSAPSRTP